MNISFMQTWPDKMGKELTGTPTYFAEKILKSLPDKNNYFPALCGNCGWKGMSSLCLSHAIADTGDYTDSICPKCYKETINDWSGLELINNGYYHQSDLHPKLHTIRVNAKQRYKKGTILQPFIWTGKPYRSKQFYFCPKIVCRGAQDIQISHSKYLTQVHIDDVLYGEIHKKNEGWVYYGSNLKTLAINDGFNSVEDFFKWFDTDFTGSIIHWTDLRY